MVDDIEDYLEHKKLEIVSDYSQKVGEFIDWLEGQKIFLAEYVGTGWSETLEIAYRGTTQLLAEFFEIDLNKIEEEKQLMLAHIANERKNHD